MEQVTETPPTPMNESNEPSSPQERVDMAVDPVEVSTDTKEPLDEKTLQTKYLSLLNVSLKELDELSDRYSKFDSTTNPSSRAWFAAYVNGLDHLINGNSLSDSVERAESLWRQKVGIDGQDIGAGKPRFGNTPGNVLVGERALLKASSLLGLGGVVQIPLWHTGIWVSIKAPSEASLLELERRIANEKVALGRFTSGMIFSNTSVYTISYVVNFVLNHIYDASIKNTTQETLKRLIKVTDIPSLVWGLICAIYPNGYEYARPCTTNPAECQHIVKGKINLSKLHWVDNASLNDAQKRMMAKRTEKFSEEDLKGYEKEHSRGGEYTITLMDELRFKLKVPTIAEYEQSGFTWVDNIVDLLENSLGVSLKGKERDEYITDQGRLTALRQYAHWVRSIEVGEDFIEDRETIDLFLSSLSSKEEISTKFFEGVGRYIDNSTVALVAIPKYRCPSCGGEQKADLNKDRYPFLLPIDIVRIFFSLLDQRIFSSLSNRKL